MFRKGSASGQPPMAYFQKSTDLRSDELHKIPEILVRHFHPHRAIGPAFFRGFYATIVVGGLENSAYGAYRKRQYQRRIAWRQYDVIKEGDLIGSYFLEHVSLASECDDVGEGPAGEEIMRQCLKTVGPSVAHG